MAKIIAFHLPQYHQVKENDIWWEEGFTEWTIVKRTKPFYKKHYQPRVPLSYYNLLDEKARENQAVLAKKYGVYGFCYYHYWFKGRLILEKPLELMLQSKQPDLPYCFCWANETWRRGKEILIEQEYGGQDDWQNHFDYLLPFFKDERYIKVDNKPMFVIYVTKNLPMCDEFLNFFDGQCKIHGFDGVYAVEEQNTFQSRSHSEFCQAMIEFEPMFTINHSLSKVDKFILLIKRLLRKVIFFPCLLHSVSYDKLWKLIHKRKRENGKTLFLGAFPDWDNTSRKGKEATVIKGAAPEKFEKNLIMQLQKAKEMGSEFLFINAWNEWSESAYLEPDKKYGYQHLEIVKRSQDLVFDKQN